MSLLYGNENSRLWEFSGVATFYGGYIQDGQTFTVDEDPWQFVNEGGLDGKVILARAEQYVEEFEPPFEFKPDEFIWSGNWKIIGRNDVVPEDYYIATLDFVMEHQQNIVDQIDYWGIVAFYGGKIDGSGYGGGYHDISDDPWREIIGEGLSGTVIIAEALPFNPNEDKEDSDCMCKSTSGYSSWYCEESTYFDSFNYDECDSSFCYWSKVDGSNCPAPQMNNEDDSKDDDFEETWWQNEEDDYQEDKDDEKEDDKEYREWFNGIMLEFDTDGDRSFDEEELVVYWED